MDNTGKPAVIVRYGYPFTSQYSYGLVYKDELIYHRTDLAKVQDYAKDNGYVIKRYKGFNKG